MLLIRQRCRQLLPKKAHMARLGQGLKVSLWLDCMVWMQIRWLICLLKQWPPWVKLSRTRSRKRRRKLRPPQNLKQKLRHRLTRLRLPLKVRLRAKLKVQRKARVRALVLLALALALVQEPGKALLAPEARAQAQAARV